MKDAACKFYVAIVDDDESLCRSVARLLRAAGYEAVTYLSAEGFLADANHPRFVCVLLDLRLGSMSGCELQRKMQASGSTTPVIYLTANDDPALREQALQSGCSAYVKKTDSSDILLAAISKAVDRGGAVKLGGKDAAFEEHLQR